ncbi:hypothetical protein CCP2SC5_1000005 [Azospirillaceae bacterium]
MPMATKSWLLATTTLCSGLSVMIGVPTKSLADPQGGSVVAGNATISRNGSGQTTIRQSSNKAIINWQSFNIGENEHTRFEQPSSSAIALNRVVGADPSSILGRLSANGHVWLVNPHGIFFGSNSQIDVAGLVATTHNITNEDFLIGRYVFQSDDAVTGTIENQGRITIADAGLVAFVAPGVANRGVIAARLGEVTLASGKVFTIDLYGDQKINLAMDQKTARRVTGRDGRPVEALVQNTGQIFADGGRVHLTAAAARDVVDNVINTSGVIQARSVERRSGEIILNGGDAGAVQVSGTLDASGRDPGQRGGVVQTLGERVRLTADARVDVSGPAGGGDVLIGGEFRGGRATAEDYIRYGISPTRKPDVPNAVEVTIAQDAVINADATQRGKGGKVVAWSEGATRVSGRVTARGGVNGGDGGFIETSGRHLSATRIRIDTSAQQGVAGNWLLDPYNLNVVSETNGSGISAPLNGVYSSNSVGDAILNSDLEAALANNNVTLQTGEGGDGNGDITISAPVSWSSAHGLTLNAHRNVQINAPLTAPGGGSLTINPNRDESGVGTLLVGPDGYVTLGDIARSYANAGRLTISGHDYTLINDIAGVQRIQSNLQGYYALNSDVSARDIANFTPIGPDWENGFQGTLEGLGHKISNVTIDNRSSGNLGLFGVIDGIGVVRNLGVVESYVTGGDDHYNFGILAGWNGGHIINSHTSGSVTGGNNVSFIGGLMGYNYGTITSSYAMGAVTGGDNASAIGGLVGYNYGTITSSYAPGAGRGGGAAGSARWPCAARWRWRRLAC